jgi:hypothetical protein
MERLKLLMDLSQIAGLRAKINPFLCAYVENPRTFSSCPFLSLFTVIIIVIIGGVGLSP